MGKNMGRDQGMGLCRQETNPGRRENIPEHYHELHEHILHGYFSGYKGNSR